MKVVEVTGWKQSEFDLVKLDGYVDEEVLFELVKNHDLVLTFFGKELDDVLNGLAKSLHDFISNKLKGEGETLSSNSKRLIALYYNPKQKTLIGKSSVLIDKASHAYTKFKINLNLFLISKEKIEVMEGQGKEVKQNHQLCPAGSINELINLRSFVPPETWLVG